MKKEIKKRMVAIAGEPPAIASIEEYSDPLRGIFGQYQLLRDLTDREIRLLHLISQFGREDSRMSVRFFFKPSPDSAIDPLDTLSSFGWKITLK